jgi:hypothetical protein
VSQIEVLDPPHLRPFPKLWVVRTNPEIHVGPFASEKAACAWASEWFPHKPILVLPMISPETASSCMAATLAQNPPDL